MKQIIFALLFVFVAPSFACAANIDATDKYARFLNTGTLINFGATNGNVTVTSSAVTGKAWSSAFGWINLSPTQGGVINDGAGVLSGYAWGENTGWINFKPTNGGVTIDSSGVFHGYAWSESKGWIVFNCATDSSCGTLSHKVKTTWVPTTTTTTTTSGSGWVNTVNSQIPQPVPPTSPEPSFPSTPDAPVTEVRPPQTPDQPSQPIPPQTPSVGLGSTPLPQEDQDSAGTISGGVVTGGDTPTDDSSKVDDITQSSSPTFQDKVFGFTTRATDAVSRFFSGVKSFITQGLQTIGRVLAAPVVGSVTVLSLAVTSGVAVLLLFVLSRIKSLLFGSFSLLLAGLSSWWAGLVALLAIKRRTSEKSSDILNKEAVMPMPVVPQVPAAPIVEVKKEEENISWDIRPQPVIFPQSIIHEAVREEVSEKEKQEPVILAVEGVKKVELTTTTVQPEGNNVTNQKNSFQKFMSMFLGKKSIATPAVSLKQVGGETTRTLHQAPPAPRPIEKKKTSVREFSNLFIWKDSVIPLNPSSQVLEIKADVPKEEPVVSKIEEPLFEISKEIPELPVLHEATEVPSGPEQKEVVNDSVPVITQTVVTEDVVKEKKLPKVVYKFINSINQFSKRARKKVHQIENKANSKGNKNKPVWNPRPPTGTD